MICGGPTRVLLTLVVALRLSGAFWCEFDHGDEHLAAPQGETLTSSEHGDHVHIRMPGSLLNPYSMLSSQAECDSHDDARFVAEVSTKPGPQFLRAGNPLGLLASDRIQVGHNAAVATSDSSEPRIFLPSGPALLVLRV